MAVGLLEVTPSNWGWPCGPSGPLTLKGSEIWFCFLGRSKCRIHSLGELVILEKVIEGETSLNA